MKVTLVFLSSLLLAASGSEAVSDGMGREAQEALDRFAADPAAAMNAPLPKVDENGVLVPSSRGLKFSIEAIESGEAMAARARLRAEKCMEVNGEKKCLGRVNGRPQVFSEIRGDDRPENLVEQPSLMVSSLEMMEQRGLKYAALSEQPWSDDYWGLYKGLAGARYADPGFPASRPRHPDKNWRNNRKYVEDNPPSAIISSGDAAAIDLLSPAEKYEMLIGDSSHALTGDMWRQGDAFADPDGNVETWIGLCEGWAQAAMMLPRPKGSVTLIASQGGARVRFYPSDAKALATMLWSRGKAPIRFVGGRCERQKPETDRNGRVVSQECFDTNPGAWHIAVVNQLGLSRRGFIVDSTYDYEIWNQPAFAYRYRYFNPQTNRMVNSLANAKVPVRTFASDRFQPYRSPKAASIVGVSMDFTYMVEARPSHRGIDVPGYDAKRTVTYLYDLELDASGNIIGGEWYSNLHPDFLWVPLPGSHSVSVAEDQAIGPWDMARELPASWRKAALLAEQSLQPLGKIVEAILRSAGN